MSFLPSIEQKRTLLTNYLDAAFASNDDVRYLGQDPLDLFPKPNKERPATPLYRAFLVPKEFVRRGGNVVDNRKSPATQMKTFYASPAVLYSIANNVFGNGRIGAPSSIVMPKEEDVDWENEDHPYAFMGDDFGTPFSHQGKASSKQETVFLAFVRCVFYAMSGQYDFLYDISKLKGSDLYGVLRRMWVDALSGRFPSFGGTERDYTGVQYDTLTVDQMNKTEFDFRPKSVPQIKPRPSRVGVENSAGRTVSVPSPGPAPVSHVHPSPSRGRLTLTLPDTAAETKAQLMNEDFLKLFGKDPMLTAFTTLEEEGEVAAVFVKTIIRLLHYFKFSEVLSEDIKVKLEGIKDLMLNVVAETNQEKEYDDATVAIVAADKILRLLTVTYIGLLRVVAIYTTVKRYHRYLEGPPVELGATIDLAYVNAASGDVPSQDELPSLDLAKPMVMLSKSVHGKHGLHRDAEISAAFSAKTGVRSNVSLVTKMRVHAQQMHNDPRTYPKLQKSVKAFCDHHKISEHTSETMTQLLSDVGSVHDTPLEKLETHSQIIGSAAMSKMAF